MSLLALFLIIVVVGVVVYCIHRFIPMAPPFKNIITIVAVIVVALLVLSAFGVLDAIRDVPVPRVK
jgi:Co/Zn/Cd efflux system component